MTNEMVKLKRGLRRISLKEELQCKLSDIKHEYFYRRNPQCLHINMRKYI